MTTINESATESAAPPVIDTQPADDAVATFDHAKYKADLEQAIAEDAKAAAEQDAALQAVRDECDAYRAGLATEG
jgi:hypothetical protein